MNVFIFGAVNGEDEFHQLLTNISSSGVVVISVHLQDKQEEFDYIQDLLRVAYDMYWENENSISHFYQRLSGCIVIAGYDEIADRILWINHENNYVDQSIKGIISLSPALLRDAFLLKAARTIQIDNILFIAGTTDAMRPISNQRPIYTHIPRGKKEMNGVCKTYIEIQGGNHCYFVDYDEHKMSDCYDQELQFPTFKMTTMTHRYQINLNAEIILEFMRFVSNPSNQSATNFQQFMINSRETSGDIEYLQSCYINDTLFAHDKYFPKDTEQPEYRERI